MTPENQVKGLVIVGPPQNSRTEGMFSAWSQDTKTPFRDIVYQLGRGLGYKIEHDPKTQVALVVFMVAATGALIWRLSNRKPEAVTGHSIGENLGDIVAGDCPAEKIVQIIHAREQICLTPEPPDSPPKGMAAIHRIPPNELDRITAFFQQVRTLGLKTAIANRNTSTQIVVSGVQADNQAAYQGYLDQRDQDTTQPLFLSLKGITDAFHSSELMAEKGLRLGDAVTKIAGGDFRTPQVRYYSPMQRGATGNGWVESAAQAIVRMKRQLTDPVFWQEGIAAIVEEIKPKVIAIPDPRGVMIGIVRQNLVELGVADKISVVNYSTPDGMEKAARIIEEQTS